jgi:hypothetical protein
MLWQTHILMKGGNGIMYFLQLALWISVGVIAAKTVKLYTNL